jgi:outer membrane protein assembly factor BamA
VNVARISAGAVFDTRDDPTDATRGSLFSFNLEHAPPTLGSQVRFLRQVSQAYRFQRWGRVVFASAARLGLAKGHDGQVVIPSERFYAGGAHSVRGVADDSLGPRDFDDTPAGGEALVVLNQEARFPIAWRFRGVGFVDAGTVFDRPSSIDLSQLVISAGAGLRITTPVGLLRVDFARPLRGASDESGRWTFGIGQAF